MQGLEEKGPELEKNLLANEALKKKNSKGWSLSLRVGVGTGEICMGPPPQAPR